MTDIFHEIEEDIRRERYERIWKDYGAYIIAGAAALVIGIGVWRAWEYYQTRRYQAASDEYYAAELQAQQGGLAAAQKAFAKLADSGPGGYSMLAKLREATIMETRGQTSDASKIYNDLIKSDDINVANLVRLRMAWNLAETSPVNEVQSILAPMTATKTAWTPAAEEVIAYTKLKTGDRTGAIADFERLSAEPAASEGIRGRASAFATFLKANPGMNPATAPAVPQPVAAQPAPAPQPAQGTSPK